MSRRRKVFYYTCLALVFALTGMQSYIDYENSAEICRSKTSYIRYLFEDHYCPTPGPGGTEG